MFTLLIGAVVQCSHGFLLSMSISSFMPIWLSLYISFVPLLLYHMVCACV